MQEWSLHILDIAQNSITAQATLIEIRIDENAADNVLDITIQDNGKGMDAEKVKKAFCINKNPSVKIIFFTDGFLNYVKYFWGKALILKIIIEFCLQENLP